MPITRDQALPLAELLCTIRPTWNTRGVMTAGLQPLERHPAPLAVIAWAAIRAAQDPEIATPAVIPLNGPHWNLADRPPTPRLTPEHECPQHPGKWAGNCPACAADKLAADPNPVDQDNDNPWADHTPTGIDAFRAARAARSATELCGDTKPGYDGTTCRRPPAHDGPHRDLSPNQLEWDDPVEAPAADRTPRDADADAVEVTS